MASSGDMITALRQLTLEKQGLTRPQFGSGLTGTLSAIEHLAYVQIDTLSVVERAHHHVLWSRVPGYEPDFLNQLVKQKQVFEYWYHAAAYLPMRDYRFALLNMQSVRAGENRYHRGADRRLMKEILARTKIDGPVRMRQFKDPNSSKSGSWSWGPIRQAFDQLFMQGDLMVCERIGMEKVYDLSHRCLPDDIDLSIPSISEYANHLFDNTLRAHGVFTWKQLIHLKTGTAIREAMQQVVAERLEAGEIITLDDPSLPNTYVACQHTAAPESLSPQIKILSPFDNAVIHRDRLGTLFNFDYRIECYLPQAKRTFGYFCLPVLCDHQFIGRIDCKAHRQTKQFEVLSFHIEDQQVDLPAIYPLLKAELQQLADFNQCPQLQLKQQHFM